MREIRVICRVVPTVLLTARVVIGIGAVIMRRLGKELNRDPMSLYRHAIDRPALLDGVAEFVLNKLVFPSEALTGRPNCAALRTTSGACAWPTPTWYRYW